MAAVLTKCKGPKIFKAFDMSASGESDWFDIRFYQHLSIHTVSLAADSDPAVAGQTRAGTLRHELSNNGEKWVTYASLTVNAGLEINDIQNIQTEGSAYYRQRWEVGGAGMVGTLNTTCNRK